MFWFYSTEPPYFNDTFCFVTTNNVVSFCVLLSIDMLRHGAFNVSELCRDIQFVARGRLGVFFFLNLFSTTYLKYIIAAFLCIE